MSDRPTFFNDSTILTSAQKPAGSLPRHPANKKVLWPFRQQSYYDNMKLVHWPLMGGLAVTFGITMRGLGAQPAQAPPRCIKCYVDGWAVTT